MTKKMAALRVKPMEHARSQYYAQHKRTAFSESFLAPDNLRQVEQMLNSELVPLIGQELAVDHELVDALHRFTVEMSSCGTVPAGVEDANRQFVYRMLKPVVAEAIPERFHNEYMQDAAEHGREPFHQRQYRHSAMERPAESSQRHHSTMTASYMLDHPYGSTDNYSA